MEQNYEIIDDVAKLETALSELKKAQKIFSTYSQEQVDRIFYEAAMAANRERIPLAKLAVEETGMGIVEDKVIKLNKELIFQTAFMGLQLKKLAKDIEKNGVTEEYKNGENQYGRKKSASADVYGTMIKSYMTAQKQLNDLIPKTENTNADDFDDFISSK